MTIKIADREFSTRLMVGTGKFDDFETMKKAHAASGAEIVTVAIRRVDEKCAGHVGLMDNIDLNKYWILPNTAGCATAEEAIRIAHLSRAMGINNWIKLEVIPDPKFLLPIGSGQGVVTMENIKIIIEQSNIPVVVDAGIGVPSDASSVMEKGADFCLINTAIAKASDPVKMAEAFKYGVMAGRAAYEAGRIPVKQYASASSPLTGIVGK